MMLAAAFVISELKTAFTIGFLILHPFSGDGYGDFQRAAGHGHDDASANDGFNAFLSCFFL